MYLKILNKRKLQRCGIPQILPVFTKQFWVVYYLEFWENTQKMKEEISIDKHKSGICIITIISGG